MRRRVITKWCLIFLGWPVFVLGWPVKTPFFRSTCPYLRVDRYDFIKYEDPDFDEPDGCPDPEGWDAPDLEDEEDQRR